MTHRKSKKMAEQGGFGPVPPMDEERLKRLCESLGYPDMPILRDAADSDHPIDRVSSTLVMIGGRIVENTLWPRLEKAYRQIDELKRAMKRQKFTGRPAHRPRLRSTAVPQAPIRRGLGIGMDSLPPEKDTGEIRLELIEERKAAAGCPMTDVEAVRQLIEKARALGPVAPEHTGREEKLIKAFTKGTVSTILKSVSTARNRGKRR